jgi:hypothetical protein
VSVAMRNIASEIIAFMCLLFIINNVCARYLLCISAEIANFAMKKRVFFA